MKAEAVEFLSGARVGLTVLITGKVHRVLLALGVVVPVMEEVAPTGIGDHQTCSEAGPPLKVPYPVPLRL